MAIIFLEWYAGIVITLMILFIGFLLVGFTQLISNATNTTFVSRSGTKISPKKWSDYSFRTKKYTKEELLELMFPKVLDPLVYNPFILDEFNPFSEPEIVELISSRFSQEEREYAVSCCSAVFLPYRTGKYTTKELLYFLLQERKQKVEHEVRKKDREEYVKKIYDATGVNLDKLK